MLKLRTGFQLESLPDEVFYKLCTILNLKPSKEGLTSYKFLKYFAQKIPPKYSKSNVQPHEIAQYKKIDVPESDKIYFCGWQTYNTRKAQNFEKTKQYLGESTYEFCKKHNVSSCWTNVPEKRKDYFSPQEYVSK